jgi:acyl-CoA synthetase (AMP-forming)/AMP-acid ligase II
MVCIWGEPELTSQRLVDGWVLTGNVGTLDRNGFLYLLDSKDDMIISGGFNIWPAELEIVIAALRGVREVAVFGVPHPRWGETAMALVVVEEGAAITEDDVAAVCRERLGSYKKPTVVRLSADPLPRTPLGKISRKALREPYWAASGRRIGAT